MGHEYRVRVLCPDISGAMRTLGLTGGDEHSPGRGSPIPRFSRCYSDKDQSSSDMNTSPGRGSPVPDQINRLKYRR